MGEEYRKWCEAHPDATEEEQEEAWQRHLMRLEARRMVMEMFLAYK